MIAGIAIFNLICLIQSDAFFPVQPRARSRCQLAPNRPVTGRNQRRLTRQNNASKPASANPTHCSLRFWAFEQQTIVS